MKTLKIFTLAILLFSFSCKQKSAINSVSSVSQDQIKTEEITYTAKGKNYKSFVAYDPTFNSLRPVVFVIPEWWGLNDYAKNRAKQLAELGYFAMAVDFYGDGKVVENPSDAQKLATPFYENSILAKETFDLAKSQLKNFKNVDENKLAAIGYCFGGAQVLNMARQENDLKGVVSFHGNLMTGVKPNNNQVKILVCNGAADSFVPADEIEAFKKEMTDYKIDFKFINYPDAIHSFTNPASTEVGKKFNLKVAYNKEADQNSWQEMKQFLTKIFK